MMSWRISLFIQFLNRLSAKSLPMKGIIGLYFFKNGWKVLATAMKKCIFAVARGSFMAALMVSKDAILGLGSCFFVHSVHVQQDIWPDCQRPFNNCVVFKPPVVTKWLGKQGGFYDLFIVFPPRRNVVEKSGWPLKINPHST